MHYQSTENMSKKERKRYNNALNQIELEDNVMDNINHSVEEHLNIIKKNHNKQKIRNQLIRAEKERRMIRKNAPHCRIHQDESDESIERSLSRIRSMHPIHIINKIKTINNNYHKIYTIKRNELRDYANGNVTASGSKNELWNEVKRVENMSEEEFLYEFTELMYLRHELKRR